MLCYCFALNVLEVVHHYPINLVIMTSESGGACCDQESDCHACHDYESGRAGVHEHRRSCCDYESGCDYANGCAC